MLFFTKMKKKHIYEIYHLIAETIHLMRDELITRLKPSLKVFRLSFWSNHPPPKGIGLSPSNLSMWILLWVAYRA